MGGSKDQKTTSYTDVPPWAQPYAKQGLAGLVNMAMPGGQFAQMPAGLQQQFYGLTSEQQQAISGMGQTAMGPESQMLGQASGLLSRTMGGEFLGPEQNPYLRQAYEQAAQSVTDQYRTATAPGLQAQAAQAGALGGSAYNQAGMQQRYGLGQTLNNLATDIYGGAYESERGRQQQAMQMAPSMGQALMQPYEQMYQAGALTQADQQAQEQMRMQNEMRQQQYPFQMGEQLINAIRGLTGQQTVSISPNLGQGIK